MKVDKKKKRVKKYLSEMGYSSEAETLIKEYWDLASYLTSLRKKAEFIAVNANSSC